VSVRQAIIDNVVNTIRESGVVADAVDSRPGSPEELAQRCTAGGFAWVYEGEEEPDETQTTSTINCDLPVTVQIAYRFDSSDPQRRIDRVGREKFADLTVAMHADIGRGQNAAGQNNAVVTLEAGNGIGELDLEDAHNVGILTSDWIIKYHRRRDNPREV